MAPRSVLAVSPIALAVPGSVGIPVPSRTVNVSNAGKGALRWSVTAISVPWLTVSPQQGTNTGALNVTAQTAGLAAGTYAGSFRVEGNNGQAVTVTVQLALTAVVQPPPPPPVPPPPSTARGPQPGILAPSGAIDILPGANIQVAVTAHPGSTAFRLRAGVHPITYPITPKTGQSFTGEFGAILDGSSWITSDDTQGAFRAHNDDINTVTIRNLVIRHMPQKGIHAFTDFADGWTVEHCELHGNRVGVQMPSNSLARQNRIHHNSVGGYSNYKARQTTWENNEIAFNGPEQKIFETTGIVFRGNWVHHNARDGIWYDANNTLAIIENNLVEDQPGQGIFYEISGTATIRNNTVRRSGESGIFISTSQHVTITGNVLEENFRGIQYFLDCGIVGQGTLGWDLRNNTADGNTIRVPTGAVGAMLSHLSTCTATQVAPYLNGTKPNTFTNNRYSVQAVSGRWWVWGFNGLKTWNEWRALGHDLTGSVL